jgi:CheY-like chemotaxis protein
MTMTLQICYVDNNGERAQRVQEALRHFDHDVKVFLRPEEAVKGLASASYDVLLVGPIGALTMTLVTAVRRSQTATLHTLPIIVLCPTASVDKSCDLMNLGANKVLTTSITPEKLHQQLLGLFVTEQTQGGAGVADHLNVCLLEDSPTSDNRLRNLLLTEGNSVESFYSLADALHAVADHNYDCVVISERHSQGSAGQRAVRKIKEQLQSSGAATAILVLTTNPSPANISGLFDAGANDVRAQPVYFDLDKLLHDLAIEVAAANMLRAAQEAEEKHSARAQRRAPSAPAREAVPSAPVREPRPAAASPAAQFSLPRPAATAAHHGEFAAPQPIQSAPQPQPLPFAMPTQPVNPPPPAVHHVPFAVQAHPVAPPPTHAVAPPPHGHAHNNHGGNGGHHHDAHAKPVDPFQATHDPLRGFFEKLKAAADRFHGADA